MNILILAYACEPNAGSEYGVGWNVPTIFAKKFPEHTIHVLTRSLSKEKILKVSQTMSLNNLYFHFYDIPKWMFYKNEMKSNWGEQINYIIWQLCSRSYIKKLNKKYNFDILHHLTFNQYRTPSPGFFLNIPFVMGPIGGAETISPSFYQDLEKNTYRKEIIRKQGKDLKLFGIWCQWKKNHKHFLFSTKENMHKLSPFCGKNKVSLLPAIAFNPIDFENSKTTSQNNDTFQIIYAGKALDWKGIYIFLKAAKKAYIDNDISNFIIKLVGIRFKQEQEKVNKWISDLHLENNIELIPFLQRNELLNMLTKCNLSVYPAFRDSGSMSVLESSVLGCPTICFNAGGQDAFPDSVLIKVDVTDDYEVNLNTFAEKLKWAFFHREETYKIGLKAKEYVYKNLTWENKIDAFNNIYQDLIDSTNKTFRR